ncbi:MAG: hypothetical protein P8O16_09575 [Algoriphagus sp.]|uniref:FkbM family methyltransferase n=1 Tax=Algoriphagus sp. TaxID=1872435 RepID=UPI00262BAF9D|nr:FkbM family methyltransferase [Algoriphagus sp.]MDG1277517.1 hypothetical protein [Algoriphagus sp.]
MMLKKFRVKLYYWRQRMFYKRLIKNLVRFKKEVPKNTEFVEMISFIEKNGLTVFPYNYLEKYHKLKTIVYFDEENFPYVIHNKNNFFFPRDWDEDHVRNYYHELLASQDDKSPHLYCSNDFVVEKGDVVVDVGVADGNFSFENIELAKKVFLFEKKNSWIKVLKKSFKPFNEKVQIVNKYVSNVDSESEIRLDSISELYNNKLFIKIDVDGDEEKVISGMQKLLESNSKIRISICTYHKHNDYRDFKKYFSSLGFSVSESNGYMLYFYDKKIKKPYFRKGLIRVQKIQ